MVPEEIFGRIMTFNKDNLKYIGSSGSEYIYEASIPRDVGTVLVEYPEEHPNELVKLFLPDSKLVKGRQINISAKNPVLGTNTNLSLSVAAGSGNLILFNPGSIYTKSGSITASNTFSLTAPSTSTYCGVGFYDIPTSTFYPLYITGGNISTTPIVTGKQIGRAHV